MGGPVHNADVYGLNQFEVLSINSDSSAGRVDYDIRFPLLTTNGFYDLKGYLFDLIPIFGTGDFLVEPKG